MLLHRIGATVLDLLYPPTCVSCGKRGSWWCAVCRAAVERVPQDPCPKCLTFSAAHDRASCAGALPFSGIVTTGFYHSPPLRKLVSAVKYEGVTAVREDAASYLRAVFSARKESVPWAGESALVIQPLPLASARERDRGFNQAALIAELLASSAGTGARVVSGLARVSSGMPQATIEDHALRAANVSGDFIATEHIADPVLLVDDVTTTGSTAADAARALLKAGAPRVYLFALAIGA